MKPTITLSLDMGWGHEPIMVTREISDNLIRRTYQALDFPSEDAGAAAIFCTAQETLRTVVEIREDAAQYIGKMLAHALLDTMQRRDTLMGYPIVKQPRGKDR